MTSSSAEDNGSHKEALRTEASRFGDTLMNPVHRYVFERGSEMAIQKIIADVPTETAASLDSLPNLQQPKRRHFRRDEKLLEYFFGTIYLKTKTSRIQSKVNNAETKVDQTDQYEHESSFIVRPARWLISLGFKYGLHIGLLNSSRRGWKQTLRPFCLVRDDSLIFRFCVVGDTIGVRSLLTRGDASVRDTDSLGRTPLHVSPFPSSLLVSEQWFLLSLAADICLSLLRCTTIHSFASYSSMLEPKSVSMILRACTSKFDPLRFLDL